MKKNTIINGYGVGRARTVTLNMDVVVDDRDCIIGYRPPDKPEQWKYISNTIQTVEKETKEELHWWDLIWGNK